MTYQNVVEPRHLSSSRRAVEFLEQLATQPGMLPSTGRRHKRSGKILILLVIMLPVLVAFTGLMIDGGVLLLESRSLQHAADSAATAAATQLRLGYSISSATEVAEDTIWVKNGMSDVSITVDHPPVSGPYSGSIQHVEVSVERSIGSHFMKVVNGRDNEVISARAIAGYEPATDGAAIVVLDPSPASLSIGSLPIGLPSLPSLVGGLEVLGLGKVNVHGAVLVNTRWGGVDEEGALAGESPGPPYAISCMPIIATTTLNANDIRVVGGVDDPTRYGSLTGSSTPLQANKLPVPDPLADLPIPSIQSDPVNVSATDYGGKTIIGLPIGPQIKLYPGVYDWINVVLGRVKFMPGIYVIRGQHPVTHHSLSLAAGTIEAEGVMFYLTDSATYAVGNGGSDALDAESPPPQLLGSVVPSAIINVGLLGSSFSPLNSPGSPFDGMTIYQRRDDRRPIVIVQENLLGAGTIQGTIYAKWGHILLAGKGEYDARFVAGTMRIIALIDCTITPSQLLEPATDVFLVE